MAATDSLDTSCDVGMGIAYHARRRPEIMAVQTAFGGRTFGELNDEANRLAHLLRAAGLRAGDALATALKNRPEYLVALFAAQRIGVRLTPINYHLKGAEIGYIVDNCDAVAFIVDAELQDRAVEALQLAPQVRLALSVGGELPRFMDFDQELRRFPSSDIENPTLGGRMLYTSGTTGRPRGVLRREVMPARPQYAGTIANYRPYDDRVLCTGPGYHGAPLLLNLLQPLISGVGVVWMDRWGAEDSLRLIAERRITHTHMVPTMLHRLLQLPKAVRAAADISSLRLLVHGAAPISVHVKHEIIDWFGDRVWEYYAATEGDNVFFVSAAEWLERPGTVGRPPPDRPFRILNDAGTLMPAGQPGFIYLPTPERGRFEYYKDPTKTAASQLDGYYTVGDIGYLDNDGYLFLTGRSSEVIISGGVNIYPQEIDDVLLRHHSVLDVCTVGVPNDEWGEEVKSVVVLKGGLTSNPDASTELISWARTHLAAFKCPRSIDIVDELPRLEAGKVKRTEVRDWYRDQKTTPATVKT